MRAPLAAAVASLSAMVASAHAAAPERFTVIASKEVVGSLVAAHAGNTVEISYQVSNNGRGPKLSEKLVLGSDKRPASWTIDGNTAFGGKVAERYAREGVKATWVSQADHGSTEDTARLYLANDASPWRFGLYARALLATKTHTLPALPAGEMHLEKSRTLDLGGEKVIAYVLTGIDLTPDVVFLDARGALYAHAELPSSVIVRAGSEAHADAVLASAREVEMDTIERIQETSAHRFTTPLRIRNVRVFNSEKRALGEPVSVVVFRGRIASVEPVDAKSSTGDALIDGAGGTLIPGLNDMHSHNTAWSGVFYLAAGVTNVRDMGNANDELLRLTADIDAGKLPGPRIVRAGFLEGRSPYSARYGFIPATIDEALADVRWYADHGYWQIKIYNSMTPDWVAPIAKEAHSLGMKVTGHVPAFMSPDRAIRDGYDEITHLNQLALGWLIAPQEDTRTPLRLTALGERMGSLDLGSPRVRATIDLMKEHHISLDPTIVVLERLMMSRAGHVNSADAPYFDHVPIGYQRYRKRSFVDFKSPEQEVTYARSFAKLMETLALLYREGIRLLPGTDDTTGFTVHRELELYAEAGIPAAEVLGFATLGCAQYLGKDQSVGSIEPGKLADFVLIEGDPTRDIRAIRRARLVMKSDTLYFPSELYSALGIRPFTTAPIIEAASHE